VINVFISNGGKFVNYGKYFFRWMKLHL
jgi:hypothetical protein